VNKELKTDDGVLELFYQTHWFISWTLVIMKRKRRRRRKTLTLTLNDVLTTVILKDHSGCYLPKSINKLVNEHSGIS